MRVDFLLVLLLRFADGLARDSLSSIAQPHLDAKNHLNRSPFLACSAGFDLIPAVDAELSRIFVDVGLLQAVDSL